MMKINKHFYDNFLYSIDPTKSVLFEIDSCIRRALHESDTALVDDIFIDLDVNKLHIKIVEQLEVATAMYDRWLPNRNRFLVRAYKEHARKLNRETNDILLNVPVCPRCSITMSIGVALPSTDGHRYIAPQPALKGDEVKLHKVFKCGQCGHSKTLDEFGRNSELAG